MLEDKPHDVTEAELARALLEGVVAPRRDIGRYIEGRHVVAVLVGAKDEADALDLAGVEDDVVSAVDRSDATPSHPAYRCALVNTWLRFSPRST